MKKVLGAFLSFLLIVGIFGLGVLVGNKIALPSSIQGVSTVTELSNTKSEFKTLDVTTLWSVWDKINNSYLVKNVDNQKLFDSAVKGLVNGLNDPYTSYITASELVQVEKSDRGELEGIGVTLRQEGEYTVVESVVDGFPASKNGIKSNDIVLSVDGKEMKSISSSEVATYIRGASGTSVKIVIYRTITQSEMEFSIVREKINIDNITLGDMKDGVLTIKIYKFTEDSVETFKSMWDSTVLKALALNPKGIILDLRGNPGGYVSGVEYILEDLVNNGNVLFYEEDREGVRVSHVATRSGRLTSIPIAVIVNGGTASASEILAGAIQDYGRGKIIGENTVGKGVEQQLINLEDGSQLRIVFRKWLTPKGNNINSTNPIKPDFVIEDYNAQLQKAYELLK